MDISALALRLVILFVPGVLAAVIIEHLIVAPKWKPFRFGTYSLLLGTASYLAYQCLLFAWAGLEMFCRDGGFVPRTVKFWDALFDQKMGILPAEVLVACGFGVVVAGLTATAIQHKWLTKLAGRLGISDKYGDENLFSYFLNAQETSWVWIRDRTAGLIYEGLRESYSESEGVREIVITRVKVFADETSEVLYEVPALYLCFPDGGFSIELPFLKEEDDGEAEAADRGSAKEPNAQNGQGTTSSHEASPSVKADKEVG